MKNYFTLVEILEKLNKGYLKKGDYVYIVKRKDPYYVKTALHEILDFDNEFVLFKKNSKILPGKNSYKYFLNLSDFLSFIENSTEVLFLK